MDSNDSNKKPEHPWQYSNEEGYLTADGKIRIFGFKAKPLAKLTEPRTASRLPEELTLKPGYYSWCTCGYSQKQPFCDNAHREDRHLTNRKSYKFQVLEEVTVQFCRCKRTYEPPFCDCQHELLPPEDEEE